MEAIATRVEAITTSNKKLLVTNGLYPTTPEIGTLIAQTLKVTRATSLNQAIEPGVTFKSLGEETMMPKHFMRLEYLDLH